MPRGWLLVPLAACFLLASAPASGQAPADDEAAKKVSNDDPGRPLQMPPASSEVKEALDDFDRFQRRGAWERALKALYTIPDDQAQRFVDGDDGFVIPVARKRSRLLAGLPPEGQVAYRLFYDDEARKLFEDAEGPDERKVLERLVAAYFPTTVGDDAADRLGDLYFEMGRFDRAADCWLLVLRDRADTDIPQARLALKSALALFRAGRLAEYGEVLTDLTGRFANDPVLLGGETATPVEHLRRLLGDEATETAARHVAEPAQPSPVGLPNEANAAWRMRFADSVVAGMTPVERSQWESNSLSAVVPATAVVGDRLFANYLGYVFALDLTTGKLLWRSESFHHLDVAAMQDGARMIDPTRFAIAATDEHVWVLWRDLKDQNYMAPYRLTCRRADVGDVVWQSNDLPDYAEFDLVGPPLMTADALFIAAKNQTSQRQNAPELLVLAIRPRDGKLLWKTQVGTMRQGQQYYYYGMQSQDPQPRLIERSGAIYVDTHQGVLARIDAGSGDVDWGYAYRTDPAESQGRFFFGYSRNQEASTACEAPLEVGDGLLLKGVKSDRLVSIDPDRLALSWERPIAKSARPLGIEGDTLFLGGPELSALSLRDRTLQWSTRLPGGSADGQLLVRPDGLWQLTSRGVFEIDPATGDVRTVFRGDDTGSVGGDLVLTDHLILAVTNRSISAYPRHSGEAKGPAEAARGESHE